jgi:phosphate starvation-inducible membrane PsiE
MKLDELKSSWNIYTSQIVEESEVQKDHISKLLKGRADNIIAKIKKSLYWEIGFISVSALIFLGILFSVNDPFLLIYSYAFLIFCIATIVSLTFYYRKLSLFDLNLPNLKSSLNGIVTSLSGYVRTYHIINITLAPFMLVSAMLYSVINNVEAEEQQAEQQTMLLSNEHIAFFVFMYLVGLVAFYFVSKFYMHKLYGVHIASLNECLVELNE